MAIHRNELRDPGSPGHNYTWHVNHSEEEAFGRSRTITKDAPTAGVGTIRQQGADSPMEIRVTGTILDELQHFAFIYYLEASRQRSVIFEDFAGDEYEVIVTDYQPVRIRAARNPRANPATPQAHYIRHYTLTMEVITFRGGAWLGVAP